jgi:hypothetical protein
MDTLRPIADRIGPSVAEVSEPLVDWPRTPDETVHPAFVVEYMRWNA